jgi:hypothetical protein
VETYAISGATLRALVAAAETLRAIAPWGTTLDDSEATIAATRDAIDEARIIMARSEERAAGLPAGVAR